ncbi:MAG: hypothetical protein ACOYIE_08225 [Agathobaculum sp.]|uniref:hypothetical protein n=1 Tax=Agathobaculum sp. TaxID=2048138 RepID=UPI003D92C17C
MRKLAAGISVRFGKLHIGGKLPLFQKLSDTRGSIIPRDDLRAGNVLRRAPTGKVDTVLGVPCGQLPGVGLETTAANIFTAQKCGDFVQWLLLHKFSGHTLAAAVIVAAEPKHMVNIRLRKRKSEGRICYALRLLYEGYLLVFRRKKA